VKLDAHFARTKFLESQFWADSSFTDVSREEMQALANLVALHI